MQEPIQNSAAIRGGFYPEKITKRAAAALTVGVPFSKDGPLISNIYSEGKPYRAGMPGEITYHLAGSRSDGETTKELMNAYNSGKQDVELDNLIEEIISKAPELGLRLKALLPFALMCYLRAGFENRERIQDLWKKAAPLVLVRRGENSFVLVHRNAPEKVLKHFGLQ